MTKTILAPFFSGREKTIHPQVNSHPWSEITDYSYKVRNKVKGLNMEGKRFLGVRETLTFLVHLINVNRLVNYIKKDLQNVILLSVYPSCKEGFYNIYRPDTSFHLNFPFFDAALWLNSNSCNTMPIFMKILL